MKFDWLKEEEEKQNVSIKQIFFVSSSSFLLITWHSSLLGKKIRTIVHTCRFLMLHFTIQKDKLMARKVANKLNWVKIDDQKWWNCWWKRERERWDEIEKSSEFMWERRERKSSHTFNDKSMSRLLIGEEIKSLPKILDRLTQSDWIAILSCVKVKFAYIRLTCYFAISFARRRRRRRRHRNHLFCSVSARV